jgi:MFS family permease
MASSDEEHRAPPEPHGLALTFRSLRHRNYRLYFVGQLISLTGSWLQTAALTWLTFELTKQSKWTATINAAQVLPTFLLGAWGGLLADRWPKRSLILVTQTALLIQALALAAIVLLGSPGPWWLLAITLFSGVVQAVDVPARLAFVIDLVGRDDLINAVALNSLLFNAARLMGPALGGILLSLIGPGPCFVVNGLSFLAILVALLQMDVVGTPNAGKKNGGWSALMGGFHYLVEQPRIGILIMLAGMMSMVGWPMLSLLPALARDVLDVEASGYGTLLSAVGGGALLAALTVATFASGAGRRRLIGAGVGIVGTSLLGLAVAPNMMLATACSALVGYGLILFFATSQGVVQLSADDNHRGRVLGIWAMMVSGAMPLGNMVFGSAADAWGVPTALTTMGLVGLVAGLTLCGALWFISRPVSR